MDAESLKIILKLQKDNILLRRAILDAILMLRDRKEYTVVQYQNDDANFLHTQVCKFLSSLEEQNKVDNT
jgi:hypothetical protein